MVPLVNGGKTVTGVEHPALTDVQFVLSLEYSIEVLTQLLETSKSTSYPVGNAGVTEFIT
jgi:hypothetical protein